MNKKKAAAILEEMADLMEVTGSNPFRIRAFRNAGRIVPTLEGDITADRLAGVKGIGKGLSEIILSLLQSDSHPLLEDLYEKVSPGVRELLQIPGLGPKKVRTLVEHLGIDNPGELLYVIYQNRLLDLPGFGEKTQRALGLQLESKEARRHEIHLDRALDLARTWQTSLPSLIPSGLLRRFDRTIGLLTFVLSDREKGNIGDILPDGSWEQKGRTLHSWHHHTPVEIHLAEEKTEILRLWETTGSPSHVEAVKRRIVESGADLPSHPESEEAIYSLAELPWIPPELRESGNDLTFTASFDLSTLLKPEDIRGCLHNHTVWSDGIHTLEEMASAARDLGWSFLGFADHSQSAYYARGLETRRLLEQTREIHALRQSIPDLSLFTGVECDILPDGSLDYPDEVLESLDFVVASVHTRFSLTREEQTERILRAIANPHVDILGHPTGRLLLAREPYDADMDRILEAAARHRIMIEINANPHRLDLDWTRVKTALDLDIPLMINPDAHMTDGLTDVLYGVMVGRKGFLTREACANTWSPERLRSWLGGDRG
ncbi:MAG TPA: helix-hairpin-helix domain-containing protein [Thermoanaerobaculia bacterium]|nr:helix-hairpin-helix domain-containing protein [Thermoanaerobaculia bacterium]HUM29644.1 helix-hairpin-helix domain-containing protein [Thermoanaerobaculia bacterium]HXK67295.1 helix-hairpin-helix domain-containing protein [Thermoanaerobaculia bacterium]